MRKSIRINPLTCAFLHAVIANTASSVNRFLQITIIQ
jgi:hypothetical protein